MDSAFQIIERRYNLSDSKPCTMSAWEGTSDKLVASISGYDRIGRRVPNESGDPSILSIIKVDEI